LIELVKKGAFQGRTGTNHIVHVEEETALQPGNVIDISIIHAGQHSLKGKIPH